MKILEISERVDINLLKTIATALNITTSTGSDDSIGDKAYNVLEKYFDHPGIQPFIYHGKMYRAFIREGAYTEFSEKELLSHKGRKLWSFAKSLNGVEQWLDQLGDYDGSQTDTITEQTGKGYDVQKIFRYIRQYSEQDIQQAANSKYQKDSILSNLNRAGGSGPIRYGSNNSVLEIVAPLNNSIKVIDVNVFDIDDETH